MVDNADHNNLINRVQELETLEQQLRKSETFLKKRLEVLTQPAIGDREILFEELFNLDEIQQIQDQFSLATGVASIITRPDGTPITRQSNFCTLCKDIIRKTDKGLTNCFKSDAALGTLNVDGPTIRPCLSGGLWDAGAGIAVGGKHVANWLIGQVRDESQGEETIREYAREIGVDEDKAAEAFREVPSMSKEKFSHISQFLFKLANQLSLSAYNNMQQARFIRAKEKAEAALRQSVSHHRTLIETIPDLIWLKDQNGIYISCNQAFERFFGATEAEIIGKTDYDFVSPELADFFRHHDRKAMEANAPSANEEWLTFADDGYHGLFETIKSPMRDPSGELIGVMGIARDITKRVQAEEAQNKLQEQLLQSQKMEAVGRLAGGLAHDFNNMLSVIIGNVDMALEETENDHPLRVDLEEIKNASKRSAELVRQLLAFARKQTVMPKVLDLNKTVTKMTNMMKRLIGEDIVLEWKPGDNLWPLKIDPSQLDQIMANLCVNARDAITGVGKITIATDTITLDESWCENHTGTVPGDYVKVSVTDTGCGMDTDTLKNIFEPFFTTKEAGKGTGLGLSTVYGIVRQNKGAIDVVSEQDRGTSVVIFLPRYKTRVSESSLPEQAESPSRGHETVLLVEDEPSILSITRRMLEKLGYTVLAALTPGEAITFAGEYSQEIHLLITDVIMPEMNGREMAKKILAFYPNLTCLFMSGYTADVIAHHGVLAEGVNFIQKPFSKEDLAEKIRQALDSESEQ